MKKSLPGILSSMILWPVIFPPAFLKQVILNYHTQKEYKNQKLKEQNIKLVIQWANNEKKNKMHSLQKELKTLKKEQEELLEKESFELKQKIQVERTILMGNLEKELSELRNKSETRMLTEKKAGLEKLEKWTKNEEKRLQNRLEKEFLYQRDILKKELKKSFKSELLQINEIIKTLADKNIIHPNKDIMEILDKKLSDLFS